MEMDNILTKWGMSEAVRQSFKDAEMDMFTLQHIDSSTISELIPTPGPRIRFKTCHQQWLASLEKKPSKSAETVVDGNCDEILINSPEIPQVPPTGDELLLEVNSSDSMLQSSSSAVDKQSKSPPESGPSVPPPLPSVVALSNTPANKRVKSYDIHRSVLQSTTTGKQLLRLRDSNKFKGDYNRTQLAQCLIDEELSEDESKVLTGNRLKFLAEKTVEFFPNEILEAYFDVYKHKSTNKQTMRGKLVNKYHNIRRKLYETGVLEKTTSNNKQKVVTTDEELTPDEIESMKASVLWLQQGTKTPWSEVVSHWKKTSRLRIAELSNTSNTTEEGGEVGTEQGNECRSLPLSIQKYFEIYSVLHEDDGFNLIDFSYMYQNVEELRFCKEWPVLSAFILQQIRLKEPQFLKDSTYSSQEEIIRILLNFNKLFPTVVVKGHSQRTAQRKGKAKQWRPSGAEAQDAFFTVVPSVSKLYELMDEKRKLLQSLKLTLQPFAALVGCPEDPQQLCVVVDDFFYDVKSALKAVEITFKAFHALHCSYPVQAEQMWLFIQSVYSTSQQTMISSRLDSLH